MTRSMRCTRCVLAVAMATLLALVLPGRVVAQGAAPAHIRVQNVLKQFVEQTGNQVIGLGSWIDGTKYKPGVSDHDLRLLMPPGTSDKAALESWNKSRDVLRNLMQKEFGPEGNKMLAKTNLYPPSQLMRNVEDTADAASRYQALNAVPTLSHTGSVDSRVAARYSEGLYGEGSKAWTQHYEQAKGKLFYTGQNGKVYSGAADLTHMAEGQAKFSAKGMGNTALGWAEHAAEELKGGDPEGVAKHLERMERDLNKARQLSGAGGNETLRKELQSLTQELRGKVVDMTKLEGRLNEAMKAGRLEANVLMRLEEAGPAQRELLEGILNDVRAGRGITSKILEAGEKVPFGAILDGLMLVVVANEAGKTAGERSIAEAAAKAIPQLASLPVGLLSEIADRCLEGAKEGGAVMAANKQGALDLVAGIYTAQGREKGFERTAKMEYTMDDLVKNIHEQSKLEGFVHARAAQAASREGGEAMTEADNRVADEIYNKNFPTILRLWQNARHGYRREYIGLVSKLRGAPLTLSYEPNPATMLPDGRPLTVAVKASMPQANLGESTERMRAILKILAGKNVYILTSVQFKGKPSGDDFTATYEVKKLGSYGASVTVSVKCDGTSMTGENANLKVEILRTADVTVEVVSPDGGSGTFAGKWNGVSDNGSVRFTIKGNTVSGLVTAADLTGGTLTGTFDAAKRQVRGTVTGSISVVDDKGKEFMKVAVKAAINGTYKGSQFDGTWVNGKGGKGNTGTWTAAGELTLDGAPRKTPTTPKK